MISVVVVCKDPGPSLHASLESVWSQREVDLELIVIDGASRDGTSQWLEAQRARLAVLRSERDTGVYDAMNKGVAATRGDWVLFLGADDRLATDTVLHQIADTLANTEAQVVVGEVRYDDGRVYRLGPRAHPVARNFMHHQGTLYRRGVFAKYGRFDPALSIMADYDFNLRLWKAKVRFVSLPLLLARCGSGGLSDAGGWRGYREEITVRHRHFPFASCLFWDAISFVRFLRKKAVRAWPFRHG